MGVEQVKLASQQSSDDLQAFMRRLLNDVRAFEHMLDNDYFESGIKRIGAEQELCLVDAHFKPAMVNMAILEHFHPDWLTTELGQFNLECNLTPQDFVGNALGNLEAELSGFLQELRAAATAQQARVVLTGILPTLRKSDLELEHLTPKPRYFALMQALKNLRGSDYEVRLEGIDELSLRHDSPLLEACNTSFQVHLQVSPKDFVPYYNNALAIAGPTMAMAANSPLLFGKRLWHETRIMLFQQSIDTRTASTNMRYRPPRVTFGNDWLRKSILEIYREDIARFRVIMTAEQDEDAFEMLNKGETPKLRALQVHNSTVYRWNRPCYGISPNGKPHLRIENRILPAGPTVVDEIANTAFWLGLMEGAARNYGDVTRKMSFDDARDNFVKGARTGIDSKFTWFNNQKITAQELILKELLPLAKEGLVANRIAETDIARYLDVVENRTRELATGARWLLRSYSSFIQETTTDEAIVAVTSAMYENQWENRPVHTWELPKLSDLKEYEPSSQLVEEFMSTDFITVRREDVLEFVTDLMDWRGLRYLPVEDEHGKLVGLLTSKLLMRQLSNKLADKAQEATTVEEIMVKNVITIAPDQTVLQAINCMSEHDIGCLPVVKEGELLGLITEKNFVNLSKRLIQRMNE